MVIEPVVGINFYYCLDGCLSVDLSIVLSLLLESDILDFLPSMRCV